MAANTSLLKVRLPDELKQSAEHLAEEMGEPVSIVVRSALRRYLGDGADQTGSSDQANPVESGSRNKDKMISARLSPELFERAQSRADSQNRSLSGYLRMLILRDLDGDETACALEPEITTAQAEAASDLVKALAKLIAAAAR